MRSSIVAILPLALVANAIVTKSGKGKLPTLGWNSWNAYHCDIDESKFLDAAKAIKSTGLADAGYNYVNIDDCWSQESGRVNGHIMPNTTKFPDGIDGLAKKVHDMGLLLGIYSVAGDTTCAGYPASLDHEDVDAADFAKWGVDYLKYDNCNIPQNWTDPYKSCAADYAKIGVNGTCSKSDNPTIAPADYKWDQSPSADRYMRMRDALSKQDHEILLGMCIWGTADVFSWGNSTGVSWRMSDDIQATWGDIMRILNQNSFRMNSVGFWGHNDADMLEVGNGGLYPQECRTHFALWAAMKSPLLIGTDLTKLSQDNINILKNKYLLAFNQDDEFGAPAKPYKWGTNPDWTYNDTMPAEYWSGKSKAGTMVLMMNPSDGKQTKKVVFTEVGLKADTKYQVTDVWSGKDLGCLSEQSTEVDRHDTAVYLIGQECDDQCDDE